VPADGTLSAFPTMARLPISTDRSESGVRGVGIRPLPVDITSATTSGASESESVSQSESWHSIEAWERALKGRTTEEVPDAGKLSRSRFGSPTLRLVPQFQTVSVSHASCSRRNGALYRMPVIHALWANDDFAHTKLENTESQ